LIAVSEDDSGCAESRADDAGRDNAVPDCAGRLVATSSDDRNPRDQAEFFGERLDSIIRTLPLAIYSSVGAAISKQFETEV